MAGEAWCEDGGKKNRNNVGAGVSQHKMWSACLHGRAPVWNARSKHWVTSPMLAKYVNAVMLSFVQNAPFLFSSVLVLLAIVNAVLTTLLARKSHKLQRHGVIESFYDRMFDWSSETMDALAEAVHSCYHADKSTETEFYLQVNRTRSKISKSIDAGRILLPSVQHSQGEMEFSMEASGSDSAVDQFYEGHLAGVFTPLLEVYRLLSTLDHDEPQHIESSAKQIIQQKIKFTELLKDACHPRKREELNVQMIEHKDKKPAFRSRAA